jgi:hypothetical protein
MTTDETTQLLAKPASDLAHFPEELDGNATATAQIGQKFALWQIGALFGKQWLRMLSSISV